ncbi:MAG: bifunctional nuclease family protein [Verrucomicrobiales bacterium]|nr:bifunctional nuclease family protein [Verrucomicrobiales bacterium]
MSDMLEVVIDSIRVALMSQQRIVILREVNAERYLAIWIDSYMAEQITAALQEVEVSRPMTHDLLKNVLRSVEARVLRVEVVELRGEVFYGSIVVEVNGHTTEIDARPSDALALAVRANCPILVSRQVMDEAGIVPEEDLEEEGEEAAERGNADAEINPERLSVFEDFLEKLDLGDDQPDGGGEEDDEEE